jgi:hypothetical protein
MNHGDFNVQMLNDPNLAVDFIIQNNPEEVQAQLSGLNLLSVTPQESSIDAIRSDVRRINDVETLQEVLTVPYINEADNWTGGYESQLSVAPSMSGGMAKSTGVGVQIVNGITALGTSIANIFVTQNQADIAGIQAQSAYDQALIGQEMQQAQIEAGKTFGIPTTAFVAVIAGIVVLFAVVLISTKK